MFNNWIIADYNNVSYRNATTFLLEVPFAALVDIRHWMKRQSLATHVAMNSPEGLSISNMGKGTSIHCRCVCMSDGFAWRGPPNMNTVQGPKWSAILIISVGRWAVLSSLPPHFQISICSLDATEAD